MNAKEYLKQAYRLNECIDLEVEKLEQLRSLAGAIKSTSFGEHIPSASHSNEAPFVKTIIKITEMQERINQNIDKLVDLKREMDDAIKKLDRVDERLLLEYRYIYNYSWEDISRTLNMSVRSVHRVHSSALRNFIVPK
ncbi:MAG: DUF1492 domain-containing protein [Parasporobacterium sp.]|nr:DUF1492 domain-containing protein [Parasporobacterium sp.]